MAEQVNNGDKEANTSYVPPGIGEWQELRDGVSCRRNNKDTLSVKVYDADPFNLTSTAQENLMVSIKSMGNHRVTFEVTQHPGLEYFIQPAWVNYNKTTDARGNVVEVASNDLLVKLVGSSNQTQPRSELGIECKHNGKQVQYIFSPTEMLEVLDAPPAVISPQIVKSSGIAS